MLNQILSNIDSFYNWIQIYVIPEVRINYKFYLWWTFKILYLATLAIWVVYNWIWILRALLEIVVMTILVVGLLGGCICAIIEHIIYRTIETFKKIFLKKKKTDEHEVKKKNVTPIFIRYSEFL